MKITQYECNTRGGAVNYNFFQKKKIINEKQEWGTGLEWVGNK